MIKSSSVSTKSLIVRHQKIISLSKNIESFFSFVALLQFVWNTFVICAIGFMVVIVSKIASTTVEPNCPSSKIT